MSTRSVFPLSAPSRCRGFTLIELLVVLSIMAILAAIAAPSILGLSAGGRMNQNVLGLSGMLEDARQYALAQDTYVWVAFAPGTDTMGFQTLTVALLASKDGIDPANPLPWSSFSYGSVPNNQIDLIRKIITLRQISLVDAGSLTQTQIPGLPSTTTVNGPDNSVASNSFFTLQVPGASGPQLFTKAVQFTPSGEVRNGVSSIDVVDLDLIPQKGNTAVSDQHNVAIIRVSGVTGEPVIYRP